MRPRINKIKSINNQEPGTLLKTDQDFFYDKLTMAHHTVLCCIYTGNLFCFVSFLTPGRSIKVESEQHFKDVPRQHDSVNYTCWGKVIRGALPWDPEVPCRAEDESYSAVARGGDVCTVTPGQSSFPLEQSRTRPTTVRARGSRPVWWSAQSSVLQ